MILGMTDLARELGVSRNQVWTWYQRRDRNGFPEFAEWITITYGRNIKRRVKGWNLDRVKAWKEGYTPNKGGRPFPKQLELPI